MEFIGINYKLVRFLRLEIVIYTTAYVKSYLNNNSWPGLWRAMLLVPLAVYIPWYVYIGESVHES